MDVTQDEKVAEFQAAVGSARSVGISEFARTKTWREKLPELGCLEIVGRGGAIGYLLDPAYARAVSSRISELEDELDRAQVAAIVEARKNRSGLKSGAELEKAAREYLDAHGEEIERVIDGD